MNKYLEKLASGKIKNFVDLVSGKKARDAAARVKYMEEAVANKISLPGARRHKNLVDDATSTARFATGAAAGGTLGLGAYGYKKYRDHQRAETIKQYQALFKQASNVQAAKQLGRAGMTGVGRILKHIGRTTADLMNTAGGGKIKDYATTHGFKHGTEEYKKFVSGNAAQQVRATLRKKKLSGPGNSQIKRQHIDEIKNLHRNRRDAKIALTGVGATGVSAYGWKKARDANKRNNPYY